jgi:cytidyltransferase-like protein
MALGMLIFPTTFILLKRKCSIIYLQNKSSNIVPDALLGYGFYSSWFLSNIYKLDAHRATFSMIYSYKKLPGLRKKLRNLKVVFLSGCFDIIHPGHIEFLEKAATLGDALVVGVLADAYIKTNKHRQAVYTQKQRARIIQALKPVTSVVLTPYVKGLYPSLAVLESLRPAVFFRQEKEHAYLPIQSKLSKLGIELRAQPMRKVHSTTKTIVKVRSMRP